MPGGAPHHSSAPATGDEDAEACASCSPGGGHDVLMMMCVLAFAGMRLLLLVPRAAWSSVWERHALRPPVTRCRPAGPASASWSCRSAERDTHCPALWGGVRFIARTRVSGKCLRGLMMNKRCVWQRSRRTAGSGAVPGRLRGQGSMPGMDHGGSSSAPSESAEADFNMADSMFAMMMIPHHEQAVEMSDMILARSDVDQRVLDLAQQVGRPAAGDRDDAGIARRVGRVQ